MELPFVAMSLVIAILAFLSASRRPPPQIIYVQAEPQPSQGPGCLTVLLVLIALTIGAAVLWS